MLALFDDPWRLIEFACCCSVCGRLSGLMSGMCEGELAVGANRVVSAFCPLAIVVRIPYKQADGTCDYVFVCFLCFDFARYVG